MSADSPKTKTDKIALFKSLLKKEGFNADLIEKAERCRSQAFPKAEHEPTLYNDLTSYVSSLPGVDMTSAHQYIKDHNLYDSTTKSVSPELLAKIKAHTKAKIEAKEKSKDDKLHCASPGCGNTLGTTAKPSPKARALQPDVDLDQMLCVAHYNKAHKTVAAK
jgi:hypothetical protein